MVDLASSLACANETCIDRSAFNGGNSEGIERQMDSATRVLRICLVFVFGSMKPALAGNEVALGKQIFVRCAVCHSSEKGAGNRIGPNLFGVVGRKAGSLPDYSYSSSMRNSGITWDQDTLARYLMAPSKMVPGTKMTFGGLPNQADAANVAAYLATLK